METFIQDTLGYKLQSVKIQKHKSNDPMDEGLNSQILDLQSKSGKTLCIIKQVEDPILGRQEKDSIDLLSQLQISFLEPIKVKGYKSFDDCYIFAMEQAKGESLSTLIRNVGRAPQYKPSRPKAYAHLLDAFARTAVVFKELHAAMPKKQIAQEYIGRNRKIISTFVSRYDRYKMRIQKEEFVSHVEKLEKQYNTRTDKIGYIHGDSHPGNIFYDKETEKISLIDLEDMGPSIYNKEDGGPCVEDYLRIIYFFRLMSLKAHLTKKEISTVETLFDRIYFAEKEPFLLKDIFYMRMLLTMQIINTFLDENSNLSSVSGARLKKKFILTSLVSLVKKDYKLSKQ